MSTLSVGTIKSNTSSAPVIQNSSGTEIIRGCSAFVNFNGTGTVAIRASFNVSSITDNGTGDYTVNFTNTLTDANYSVSVNTGSVGSINSSIAQTGTYSSSSIGVFTSYNSATLNRTLVDMSEISVSIFR